MQQDKERFSQDFERLVEGGMAQTEQARGTYQGRKKGGFATSCCLFWDFG
jgi:hypothetical protein